MTIVGRSQIDHPALGTAGGSALHASIETIYTNIGNDLSGRYDTASAVANSTLTTFEHNFGVDFSNLKVNIYTGTHPNLTLVSDPVAAGWTIAATSGFTKTKIDVTTPGSGGPHTFAVFVTQGREIDATSTVSGLMGTGAQTFAGAKTWNDVQTFKASSGADTAGLYSTTTKWTLGKTTGLGTGAAAYHQVWGSVVSVYATGGDRAVFANDTGVNIFANQYRDSAGTSKAISTVTGLTALSIVRRTSSTDTVLLLQANYQDAQTADSASIGTNTRNILEITAAGSCTFGPTSGGNIDHNFRSNGNTRISVQAATSSTAYIDYRIAGVTKYEHGYGTQFYIYSHTAGANVATASDAGAWTFGPGSGAVAQAINGNTTIFGSSGTQLTLNKTSTPAYIQIQASASNIALLGGRTGGGFEFYQSTPTLVGYYDNDGAWTLGTTSTATQRVMTIESYKNNGGNDGGTVIRNNSTTTDANGLGTPALTVRKMNASDSVNNLLLTFYINAGTGSGAIAANGTNQCTFVNFSDRRLKENINPLSGELSRIMALNPVSFDYKAGGNQTGFIAQEMQEVYPDAVGEGSNGMLTIAGWDKTTARLVKAIQELKAENDALKARVEALET